MPALQLCAPTAVTPSACALTMSHRSVWFWQIIWNPVRILWENYANVMENLWKTYGKPWETLFLMVHFWLLSINYRISRRVPRFFPPWKRAFSSGLDRITGLPLVAVHVKHDDLGEGRSIIKISWIQSKTHTDYIGAHTHTCIYIYTYTYPSIYIYMCVCACISKIDVHKNNKYDHIIMSIDIHSSFVSCANNYHLHDAWLTGLPTSLHIFTLCRETAPLSKPAMISREDCALAPPILEHVTTLEIYRRVNFRFGYKGPNQPPSNFAQVLHRLSDLWHTYGPNPPKVGMFCYPKGISNPFSQFVREKPSLIDKLIVVHGSQNNLT